MGPWGIDYRNAARSPDPVKGMLARWPMWLQAEKTAKESLANVFAKVRLGRI